MTQHPDSFAPFFGTLFSATPERSAPGAGFTHRLSDRVSLSSPALGALLRHLRAKGAMHG
jgi:fumarylacetoacetate (FAA) hydrolase family protein